MIESEEVGTCSYLTCTRGEGGKDPLFHSYYYYYMHVHEHNLLQFAYQTASLPLQGEERQQEIKWTREVRTIIIQDLVHKWHAWHD